MQRIGGGFKEQKWGRSQAGMIDCAYVYIMEINLVSLKKEFFKSSDDFATNPIYCCPSANPAEMHGKA